MKQWQRRIVSLSPCADAMKWLTTQATPASAWRTCKRGDWMLWIAAHIAGKPGSDGRRKLVLAACECARLGLSHVPVGEMRPLRAIETAEAWARGTAGVSLDNVRGAAYAASAYADAAAADAAYAAAAYADADAAAYADAACAASAAAAYAAYAAAADRSKTLARCADIVRRHYSAAEIMRGLRSEK